MLVRAMYGLSGATVVSDGVLNRPSSMLSNPTMAMSPGTSSRASYSARSAPSASRSLKQKMASGGCSSGAARASFALRVGVAVPLVRREHEIGSERQVRHLEPAAISGEALVGGPEPGHSVRRSAHQRGGHRGHLRERRWSTGARVRQRAQAAILAGHRRGQRPRGGLLQAGPGSDRDPRPLAHRRSFSARLRRFRPVPTDRRRARGVGGVSSTRPDH